MKKENRPLLIAASILAARKLAQYQGGLPSVARYRAATLAIASGVRTGEVAEIGRGGEGWKQPRV